VDDRASREEQQSLHRSVIPDVEQRAGHAEQRERRVAARASPRGEPEADRDQAEILDARIGERALQVALLERERDAEPGAREPERGEARSRRGRERTQQHRKPQEPVPPELHHRARHQRGYMRGRCGVGFGQPDVEWNHAGLHAEADETEQ
jgi:hypothetical protein